MSLNRATLIGNLGKDPEIRSFQNGGRVASLSVATSTKWKDKTTGEVKTKTEWHRVSVTADHTVTFIEKNFKKGAPVYVEGQLETRKWKDKDGSEKYTTEIVIRPYGGRVEYFSGTKEADYSAALAAGDESPAGAHQIGEQDELIPF